MPTIAQGKRDGLTVGCSVHPTRIDFNLNPPMGSREIHEMSLVLIEDTVQLQTELVRLIDFIGGGENIGAPVSRVGLNLHFVAVIPSILEANEVLINALPERYRVRIKDEEDFVFQVNQPRMSRNVEGVKINYITKWSIERFQMFNISITVGAPVIDQRGLTQKGPDFVTASVMFDHNNVPVNFSLDGKQQSALLVEDLTAAKEMQRDIGLNIEGF
jgi:hypothetical protein